MITVDYLKSEIEKIKEEIEGGELKPAAEKRLRKKIHLFKQCILYVQSNPSEKFCKSEATRINNRVKAIQDRFPADKYSNLCLKDFNAKKKEFEKIYEVPKLRLQMKILKFLLATN